MFAESRSLVANTSGTLTSGNNGGREFKTNYSSSSSSSSNNRGRPVCEYCKKLGHSKDKCFKLHGYPQSFNNRPVRQQNQFQRQQNPNQNQRFNDKGKNVAANCVCMSCDFNLEQGNESGSQANNQESHNVSITREQYGQLAHLLRQFQGISENLGNTQGNTQISGPAANFAGPFNEEASGNW